MLFFGCYKRICPAIQLLSSFGSLYRQRIKLLIWHMFATHAKLLDHLVERKDVNISLESSRISDCCADSRWIFNPILTELRQLGWFRISRLPWDMFLIHFYRIFCQIGETSLLHYPFWHFRLFYSGHFGQSHQDGCSLSDALKKDKKWWNYLPRIVSTCTQGLLNMPMGQFLN